MLFRSPTIELAPLSSTQLTFGTRTLQRFTVSADSAGSISWNQIKFDISKTETALFSTVELYDGSTKIDGNWTESADLSTALGGGTAGNATSGTLKFVPAAEQQIAAGSTKTYELRINVTAGVSNADFIMSRIAVDTINNDGSSVAADNDGLTNANLIWSDMSASGHSTTTTDWTNSYMVKHLSTDTQVLTGTIAP